MLARTARRTKLVKWLAELLKQPVTLGIIAFLAVFIGRIAYLYPRAPTEKRIVVVSEYVVCESEYEKDCGPQDARWGGIKHLSPYVLAPIRLLTNTRQLVTGVYATVARLRIVSSRIRR
jgi:hypothetical protein